MRPEATSYALVRAASQPAPIAAFRQMALALLQQAVPFDAGFLHELNPRSPLSRAGLHALDDRLLRTTLGQWDEMAVTFEPMWRDAKAHGGVALARRAFHRRPALRKRWFERIGKPLRAVDLALVHLAAGDRVIAAAALVRRAQRGEFSADDEAGLAELVPALAAAEALAQRADTPVPSGLVTSHACVDGRLTPRQRQVVELVALGNENRAIAASLGISPHTVRNLLVAIGARLGAAGRAEIVHRAVFL